MAENIIRGIVEVDASKATAGLNQVVVASGKAEAALKKVAPGSNQATQALTNLGRVAQDAPYGFIGIANNINPLLESFQRLKAETGSTKLALGALGSSLMGAGGLGLAVSVASSLLVVFGDKLLGSSKSAEDHEKVIQTVETSYDRFNKAVEDATETLADEGNSFTLLVPFIKDYNLSVSERSKLLDQLNAKYPSYLKSLRDEKIAYDDLTGSLNQNIENIAIQSEIKGMTDAMGEAFGNAVKLQIELNQLRRYQIPNGLLALPDDEFKSEEKRLTDEIRGITNSLKAGRKSLEIVAGDGKSLLNILFPELNKTNNKEIEDIVAKAKRIFSETKEIITLKLDIRADDNDATQKRKAQEYLNKYFSGNYQIKLKTDLILDTKPEEVKSSAEELAASYSGYFYSSLMDQQGKAENPLDSFLILDTAKLEKQKEIIAGLFNIGKKNSLLSDEQQNLVTIAGVMNDIVTPAFTGMFDSILKGQDVFKNFFKSLVNGISQMISKLAGMAALSGILSLLFPSGFAGVKGFGKIFKNLLGFRAGGGSVSSGGSYIVGERGPEIFTPSANGNIIPNHSMSSYSGGSLMGQVQFVISGNNLVGVLASANRYQGRVR